MTRRIRAVRLAVAVVLVALFAAPHAMADSVRALGLDVSTGGGCPAAPTQPDTRAGEIATANTYLRSLVTHDTSQLQVSNDVVRTENGGTTATGADQLCSGNQGPVTVEDAVLSIRQLRWPVVDGDQAIAFYLLDSPTSPTYIAERFRVDGGLIHHIEAIFYIDTTGLAVGPESVASNPGSQVDRLFNSDDGPAGFFAPADRQGDIAPPAPAPRGVVDGAARSYLHALVSHDASGVPFAGTVAASANRRDRSGTADQVRQQIASPANAITGITDTTVYVEGDQAVAMYRIVSPATDAVGVFATDTWAATRFTVRDGRISQIESICASSALCGFSS